MQITFIEKKDILEQVIKAIATAKREVFTTHFIARSTDSSLPERYAESLAKQIKKGVVCKRVTFIDEYEISTLEALYKKQLKYLGENKKSSDIGNHQQMILIDGHSLFIGMDKKGLTVFFYTQEPEIIAHFVKYFSSIWEKGEIL